jgi:hypothetical protein
MLANHPDLASGTRSKMLTGNLDIPGTVLDIAGDSKPLGVSRSLLAQLNPELKQERSVNFSELGDGIKIVEDGEYRYCYYPFTGFGELLHLDGNYDERLTINDNPEYEKKEREFLKQILDFEALNNGIHIQNNEMVPASYAGIRNKYTGFHKDKNQSCRRVNEKQQAALEDAKLDPNYMDD